MESSGKLSFLSAQKPCAEKYRTRFFDGRREHAAQRGGLLQPLAEYLNEHEQEVIGTHFHKKYR